VVIQTDVVVVGGGPAGTMCARQLAADGHDVVLADHGRPRRRVGETSGPMLWRLLRGACGVDPPRDHHRPLAGFASAWGQAALDGRSVAFWHAEQGTVLDRPAFDTWLRGSAAEAGVTVLDGCRVTGGGTTGDRALVRGLIDARELTIAARVVVEATGRAARCLTQHDATRIAADALVCVWAETATHQAGGEAVIEACAPGWWYTVAIPDGGSVVALFTDADLVPPIRQRGEWFRDLLGRTDHVRHVACAVPADSALGICGARTSARRVLWRDTYLAVGDAAWCLDPLAGMGVERSVQDGIDAAKAVSLAIRDGDPAPLHAHALATARSFNEQLDLWRRYYAIETRWRDAPFWRRRAAREPDGRRHAFG